MITTCRLVPERCIACGLCAVYAPDIFDYDEAGIVLFKEEPEANKQFVRVEEITAVKKAAAKCPVRAILLEKEKVR
ncbi:ferredoxin [Enterococcus saigonensis]|uniref:Ferredoxin n=1 Tax=Enterococcus saigonensis TaxID=1805431 RepID=A0A679IHL0_9ENTE|nr:ferredoxin [Enterococcus saigonensis]BCA85492.1 ferredoxin [Enterococcus saigonensis]